MHQGSKETYDKVGIFDPSKLPFSAYLGWSRMGLMGMLSDFYLSFSSGDILEIGAGESTVYFSWLAQKYNRRGFFCDLQGSIYENALTVPGYFQGNHVRVRVGEEPPIITNERNIIYTGSSDSFFESGLIKKPLAVALIDGGHEYETVRKDFWNIVPFIEETGAIFLHDCYPPNEEYMNPNLCGTGYKLRQEIQEDSRFDVFTFVRSAINVGLTMVRKKPENLKYFQR